MNSNPKYILVVAGARPNFMKVAPLMREFSQFPERFDAKLVHTGQHYDAGMSDVFFQELEIPTPDFSLGVGSGSHAEQTAKVMLAFERVCLEKRPDLVVVVGDVNSTVACALTAKKLGIAVAHVEAGLRSRDWDMPEEINRLVTDSICDFLLTTSQGASENLASEGADAERIHFVGNVMIDCLLHQLPKTDDRNTLDEVGVSNRSYAMLTLHRPSNVDDRNTLTSIVDTIIDLSRDLTIVWPIHPRTYQRLSSFDLLERLESEPGLKLQGPLGYLDMLALNRKARMILTDSGGLQEEATALGVPCITLRENTERPVTIAVGANRLVGNDSTKIRDAFRHLNNGNALSTKIPELWDGKASARIVELFRESLFDSDQATPESNDPLDRPVVASHAG